MIVPPFNTTREVIFLAVATWRIAGIKHVDASRNESFIVGLWIGASMIGKRTYCEGKKW